MKLLGLQIPLTAKAHFVNEEKTLPSTDIAWSEDAIFQSGKKTKYNPDNLIGKKGHAIYRRMMLDEQVKAVVKFKRDAITSRKFVFDVDREKLGDEEADRRIALCESIVTQMQGNFTDALNGIMTAMFQGVSYSEKNFAQIQYDNKTYWGIDTIRLKPFDTFEFIVDDFGNAEKLVQEISGRRQDIDITKMIHHVQNPEYDAQYGQSELREAYRAWFSKDMAITFYNMWMERSASGFKWIKTTAIAGTPAYIALQNVLTNTVNGAGMILGGNDEFNIQFPTANVPFKEAIDMHDLGIARALLVPNLMGITPAGQTGSYSQSDTQLEAFLWTLDQDAARLEEAINEQCFRQLGEVNFGDDYWPRLKFQPISEKRKLNIVATWKDLMTAGAVKRSDSDEAHLREMLEFPEIDEESVDEDETPDTSDKDSIDELAPSKGKSDETITGLKAKLYAKQTFTKAMARVDFTVMQRTTETMEELRADDVAAITFAMTNDAVDQVRTFYAQDDLESRQLSVKFSKKDKTKLQKTINNAVQDFWKLGQRHAENEIDKAKGMSFSLKVDRDRLAFISEDFFKIKSFKVAGKLSDDLLAIISNVIASGIKGGKTFATIEEEIYLAVGGAGFLTKEDYRKALGAAIDPNIKNTQARIDTMLRTNGFEAINEARYSYFTDPQLQGFVQALEYSAIMDSRTTQICQHLDGETHAINAN